MDKIIRVTRSGYTKVFDNGFKKAYELLLRSEERESLTCEVFCHDDVPENLDSIDGLLISLPTPGAIADTPPAVPTVVLTVEPIAAHVWNGKEYIEQPMFTPYTDTIALLLYRAVYGYSQVK